MGENCNLVCGLSETSPGGWIWVKKNFSQPSVQQIFYLSTLLNKHTADISPRSHAELTLFVIGFDLWLIYQKKKINIYSRNSVFFVLLFGRLDWKSSPSHGSCSEWLLFFFFFLLAVKHRRSVSFVHREVFMAESVAEWPWPESTQADDDKDERAVTAVCVSLCVSRECLNDPNNRKREANNQLRSPLSDRISHISRADVTSHLNGRTSSHPPHNAAAQRIHEETPLHFTFTLTQARRARLR